MINLTSRLRIVFIGFSIWSLAGTVPAAAQSYPDQVIKIMVPFVAGGAVDVVARIVAPKLAEAIGQNASSKTAAAPAACWARRPSHRRRPTVIPCCSAPSARTERIPPSIQA